MNLLELCLFSVCVENSRSESRGKKGSIFQLISVCESRVKKLLGKGNKKDSFNLFTCKRASPSCHHLVKLPQRFHSI